MTELLSKGALKKVKLPIFFTMWVDKTSLLCMFIHARIQTWSASHLKAGC
jgi:hypothetical protein